MNLTPEAVRQDAKRRQRFAEQFQQISKEAAELYPGQVLQLATQNSEIPFVKLTYSKQILEILRTRGEAMQILDLLTGLHSQGSDISRETLITYLSKGKGKTFHRIHRGLWSCLPV